MKYLKSFNESIRDKMTPKSKEDILKSLLEKKSIEEILLLGCENNDRWLVDFAFENGVDINKIWYSGVQYGSYCLSVAATFGHYQIAKLLIEKGVKVTLDMRNNIAQDIYNNGGKRMLNLFDKHLEKTNESIRDKMTGKSKEEILKTLEGKPYLYIINKIKQHKLNIDDMFTKDELDKIKTNGFCYIDDDLETIFVDREELIKIVSCVGEGVRDMYDDSKQPYRLSYQNEIVITFWENAWGGVSLKEWNELDRRLKEFEGKNGFYSYDIIPETSKLIMTFDSEYPMEEL